MARHRVEPLRDIQPPFFARKMSEVLLDFAEPLLETFSHPEDFEAVICLAVICWNCSLLPANEQREPLYDIIDKLGKSDPLLRIEVEDCIHMLLERKKTIFANNRRMIADFQVVEEREGPRLLVMSTFVKD